MDEEKGERQPIGTSLRCDPSPRRVCALEQLLADLGQWSFKPVLTAACELYGQQMATARAVGVRFSKRQTVRTLNLLPALPLREQRVLR
jgi:hypothetical protein